MFSKNPDVATATLKQALTVGSRSSEILVALGNIRVRTGKPDQVEILYKQALAMA